MENPDLPKLVDIPVRMQKRFGRGAMLVPSPREVDDCIRGVRKGRVTTVSQIRQFLAGKYSVSVTCPLTTGIFIRIAAEAAEEAAAHGARRITPYWRVVRDDGSLIPKFPGGVERQAEHLQDEGHRVLAGTGKKPPRVVMAH